MTHADRDRSEEPTRDDRVEPNCTCWPEGGGHDGDCGVWVGATPLRLPPVDVPGRWMTDAELAEKDATIARLEAEVERLRGVIRDALGRIAALRGDS